jgi:molybdopterin-biosynthesis enzyme MoeA-like protein
VSAAPGFRIGNVHVMAGVPVIMKAMLESIAPTLEGGRKVQSVSIRCAVGEGAIGGPFGRIQEEFPDVKMGSYPQMGHNYVMTELVLRSSDEGRLAQAAARVREMVREAHRKAGLPETEEAY